MSKGKKEKEKTKEGDDILTTIDNSINNKFEEMKLEIEFYQGEIKKAEKKAKKKAYKKMKKNNTFYVPHDNSNTREMVIRQMEGTNFFERVSVALKELVPLARVIAELVKSLIVAILSVDSVKYRIKPKTLVSMQNVYSMANSVVKI